jgi:hypothetical protein
MKTRYWTWGAIIVILFPFVFCLDVPKANAQDVTSGAILGSVTDPSGAAIPDAEVTITNMATQATRVLRTDSTGSFDVEGLPASGTIYNVTVQKEGFQTFVSTGVKLDTGMRIPVNAQLKIGAASTEITVAAFANQVQTESGAVGGVIGSTQIQELQLNGRNFLSLQMLTPGVNPTDSAQESGGGGLTTFNSNSINGLPIEFSTVLIDGIYNMNTGDMNQIDLTPSMEAIAEFRVLTSSYSAKYGLSGNGIVMVESKSGTKDFHGSGYEFLRNDALDARNFYSAGVPPLRQNIFGFSIGGPVFIPHKYNTSKSKTFFFGSEEFRRRHVGDVFRTALPTADMRNGDFSNVPGSPGLSLSLDQSSQALLAQEHPGVNCLVDPTHINSQCFDPNSALEAGRYWPPPNTSSGFLNFNTAPLEVIDQREDLWRVDHRFNDKYSLVARYGNEVIQDNSPYGSQTVGWTRPGAEPVIGDRIQSLDRNNMIRFNMQMAPTITNTATFAQTSVVVHLRTTADAELVPGFNANFPYGFADLYKRSPVVSFAGGWAPMGVSSLPLDASDQELFAADDFTAVKGHHVIQAGMLWMKGVKRQSEQSPVNGSYYFSGSHTGNPVADFLLGLDSSFTQSDFERRGYMHYWQIEEYIQDDWKATPKLTINIGLRNLYYSPDTMEGNGLTDFDPAKYNPAVTPVIQPNGQFVFDAQGQPLTASGTVANPLNGLIYRGQNGVTPGLYSVPSFLPQPRFGFAYDIGGNGKTVVRGGGSLGYNRVPLNHLLGIIANPPFVTTSTYINGTMTNPTAGAAANTLTPVSLTVDGPPGHEFSAPRIVNWNLTVEREIARNAVLSVGYVGSAARDLRLTTDMNFPVPVSAPSVNNPGCLQAGESASPAGGFNFDPCLNQGVVSSEYTRLTWPGWSSLTANGQGISSTGNLATANYHSLQVGFRYQAHGLTLTSAYTYGKSMSEFSGTGSGTQNPRNARADYGPVSFDRTQMLNFSYVYDLPVFKGRKDLVGKGLGGWTVSGLTTIDSGFPITMGVTGNTGLASRPDCVGNANGSKTLDQWFNTSAFVLPAYGYFGNCGVGLVRGPALNTWNAALYKTFPIGERIKTQFRAEFFNFPNHPSFSGVSNYLGTGNFGQVTSALQPRILEFALRLEF